MRRWVPAVMLALIAGGMWWWAVLRMVLAPGESGPLEGAVAVGGWGLSLLPVHVVELPGGRRRQGGGYVPRAPLGRGGAGLLRPGLF